MYFAVFAVAAVDGGFAATTRAADRGEAVPTEAVEHRCQFDIKQARLAAGMSIVQADQLVRVSERTWQRWESGEGTPPPYAASVLFALLTHQHPQWVLMGKP